LNAGVLSADITKCNKARAIELGFSAMDVPKSYGGLELPLVEQVAVWEQLGRYCCCRSLGSDQRNPLDLIELGVGIEPFTPLNSGFRYQEAHLVYTQIE